MASFKNRPGYMLKGVQAAMRARLDETLADKGITTPQYTALTTLEHESGISNAEIARLSFVTPQTMLRIIENLEQAGLVTRQPHPTHGRVVQLALTPAGRKLVARCHESVLAVEEQLVSRLSRAERRQLVEILQKCAAALGEPPAARARARQANATPA